jgi:hypothetical protein
LFWVLAGVVPLVTILSTHLWLRSGYSSGVFHLQGFLDQYDHGIYRYRLLGREALLFIYRRLSHAFHDRPFAMPRDPDATLLFYGSYVVLNTLCFSLSNFLLLSLLSDNKRRLSDIHLAMYFYLTLVQALAMDVVNPYDQLAYSLVLISLFATKVSRSWVAYATLGFAAVAGSLTRETQFLVTSALFSVALFSAPGRARRFWASGICNLVLFGFVYVALRVALPGSAAVAGGWTYGGKWAIESVVVLALLTYISMELAVRVYPDARPTFALLFLSAPYILTVLITGALRELRLLVPILLTQAFVYVSLESAG